nr:calcium homeostasis endoplasmic reticulum protein-like isoform X1 [Lytechinus pictus]
MEVAPQPPADTDLQNIIDKLANFVARNGSDFEMMTKEKQKDNPKFRFLFGGEYYNYYQYKVTSEQRSIQQQKEKLAHQQAIIQDVITQHSIQSAPWQPQIQQQQQLDEQISQIEEQISQSEDNLGKQKQVLLQQQTDQIDSVLASSREKAVIELASDLDVNLSELDNRLQTIIDACTKDAISNGKQWIFSTARSPKHCKLIAKYLLHQILAKAAPFTAKLHLIYLINDVLYHCTRRNAQDLQHALEDTVVPIFCSTHAVADEDQKGKLEKVLKLWETNNYFDRSVMEKLKNPSESLSQYQAKKITENGEAIQQLQISTQTQLTSLQKQHNDYVVHMRQQQAQYQQQRQQQQQQQAQQQLVAASVATSLPQVPTSFSMSQQVPPQVPQQVPPQVPPQVTQQVTQSMQPQVVPQGAIPTVSGFPPSTSEAQQPVGAAPPTVPQPQGQLAQNVNLPQGMVPVSDPVGQQGLPSLPPGMPPQIGNQPPPPQMPPQIPAGLPPMDPSMFPGGFPPVFNPSVPPPIIRPPFPPPFPPGALPPNFALPPNIDFSKPPPGFMPGMEFPPMPMPPIAQPPPAQDPNDPSLMPRVPYYDLPAGLMAPLVSLEDTDYNPLDSEDIRLPPPQAPSERLLAAVEAFYAPPSRDAPRNSEGWEQNGLFEFFKAKQKYSKLKKEREKDKPKQRRPLSPLRMPAKMDRSPSPPTPAAKQLTPPPKQDSRRRYRSRSRSKSRSPSHSPPRRTRCSRTHSRSRSPPSRFYRRGSRSRSRSRSRSPPYRRDIKRDRSPGRDRSPIRGRSPGRSRSPVRGRSPGRGRSPKRSPTPDYGIQPFYQMNVDVKLGEDNKGHQLMKKMGWSGQGLGAKEQGIVTPIASGDVRQDLDKFKGIGMDINDPFESFRKSKSYTYNRRK